VDGDGNSDLDPTRIYYFGQSSGGRYGALLLAVDPDIRAGVLNVPGGTWVEVLRLGGGSLRTLLGQALATRVPSLINQGGITFNENLPLRNQPPIVNDVEGAIEIQDFIDNQEWVQQADDSVAYAPHIRRNPFFEPKPVIFQFAKGDMSAPNPTMTAILRAGDLADTVTYFRNDLAWLANPAVPKNPHSNLLLITTPSVAAFAFAEQQQIATFFASDGTVVIDPDGEGPLFEVPIIPPLPEDLNFIP
jgi:hypothetical protein